MGYGSVVCGGFGNTASGASAVVTGGVDNTATGIGSTVSGEQGRTAERDFDWVAGPLFADE
jgi:hypothetical protein